ncbi:protein of unknown function [Burkholderia multivorans]
MGLRVRTLYEIFLRWCNSGVVWFT